jgi:hypothetical protein
MKLLDLRISMISLFAHFSGRTLSTRHNGSKWLKGT